MGCGSVASDHDGPDGPGLVICPLMLLSRGGGDQHRRKGGKTGEAQRQGHACFNGRFPVFLNSSGTVPDP